MRYLFVLAILALSACSSLPFGRGGAQPPMPTTAVEPDVEQAVLRPEARPSDLRKVQTILIADEKVEEVAEETNALGTTVASLGNPAEPGLWLKTPLVNKTRKGTVTAANGKTVEVQLIPLDGPETGGGRMSLPAFLALGLPLTDLPKLAVHLL